MTDTLSRLLIDNEPFLTFGSSPTNKELEQIEHQSEEEPMDIDLDL